MGYGLRYSTVSSKGHQDGWRVEHPDNWPYPGPDWRLMRKRNPAELLLRGFVAEACVQSRARSLSLIGVPFDRPSLLATAARQSTPSDFSPRVRPITSISEFSGGDFVGHWRSLSAESLTRVFYPDDTTSMGQGLRFVGDR